MPILCKESLRVVCLCGGSGAELIALALSYNHSSLKEMHVTVVDKEPLWHASSSPPSFITSSLNRLFAAVKPLLSFSLSFEFIVADLLAPISFASTLQSASICTIVYGISELLDFDEAHSLAFLHSLRDLLPEDCLFMVVDPLSHQFCCEKEIAVKRAMMGNGSVQREEKRPKRVGWKLLYEGHDKVSVTRSILEPLIIKHCASLNMQINRDIKLSCHTWCVLLRKEGPGDSIPPPLPSPHTTLLLTQFPCIENIVATLRPLHTNLWLPCDACDETNPTISDRLLRAWMQNGGVLCLPYTVFKALAARRGPVECSLLVLHNYDCYAEGEKEETAHAVLESVVCEQLVVTMQREDVVELEGSLRRAFRRRASNAEVVKMCCVPNTEEGEMHCIPDAEGMELHCIPDAEGMETCCVPDTEEVELHCVPDAEVKEMRCSVEDVKEMHCIPDAEVKEMHCIPDAEVKEMHCIPDVEVMEMRCNVEDVMRRKATSGFVWTTERVATAATPLQTELLAECEGASLRQVVMIHPALVLEKKVVSGKQFNPTVRKCEGVKSRRCSACGSDIP